MTAKEKKGEKSSRKEGKIRASLKWFRRTKNFHTTVQSLRLSGNEEEIKKRADYQQRMLLRHGVINTAKISAGIIKIIASNVLLLLPIISLFLLLSLLFLGVKAERQSVLPLMMEPVIWRQNMNPAEPGSGWWRWRKCMW